MTTTNPTLLTMPIAKNGNKNAIPATTSTTGAMSQSLGFPPETSLPLGAGGVAPSREDFNGAFNFLSNIAFYAQKGWTFEYDENQDYYKGCVIIDPSDGNRYECVADMEAGTIAPHSDTANTYWKEFHLGGGLPIGTIFPYAGTTQPPGALLCNGAAVSRTMYADLFDVIGTKFGSGDGSTTFNLPSRQFAITWTASHGENNTEPVIFGKAQKNGTLFDSLQGYQVWNNPNSSSNLVKNKYATNSSEKIVPYNRTSAINITDVNDGCDRPLYVDMTGETISPTYDTDIKYYIQAFNDSTDPALVDLTQILQDLANRLTREQTPAFNHRDVITTSGTYTAPVTGWYRITVKGGGGGGLGGGVASGGFAYASGGGGEGGTTIAYERMTAGDTATVTVGAGGSGSAVRSTPATDGGDSSVVIGVNTYTGGGGKAGTRNGGAGGTGTVYGASGGTGAGDDAIGSGALVSVQGGVGGGNGGGIGANGDTDTATAGVNGGGGGGGGATTNRSYSAGKAGGDGFVWFEYFASIA